MLIVASSALCAKLGKVFFRNNKTIFWGHLTVNTLTWFYLKRKGALRADRDVANIEKVFGARTEIIGIAQFSLKGIFPFQRFIGDVQPFGSNGDGNRLSLGEFAGTCTQCITYVDRIAVNDTGLASDIGEGRKR